MFQYFSQNHYEKYRESINFRRGLAHNKLYFNLSERLNLEQHNICKYNQIIYISKTIEKNSQLQKSAVIQQRPSLPIFAVLGIDTCTYVYLKGGLSYPARNL